MSSGHERSSRLSRIVFGTLDLPDDAAPRLLDRFHEAGGRALDLANVYREGESQLAVGRWLRGRGGADGLVIYAKGCHPPNCRPDLVRPEVEKVLGALGVDRIDVFLLHRDDTALPVAAWADALLAEVDAGRIGAFGVSNWTLGRTRELAGRLEREGTGGLVAFSNNFSLAEMLSPPWPDCLATTREELPALASLGLPLLAWSSVARGYFAGRDDPDWSSPANEARRARARELAARLGTTPTAVALAYVLNQPEHVLPVVGTRSVEHLDEALAAASLELSPGELEWLERGTGA